MTDKHSKNNKQNNTFFDKSFDEPYKNSRSNRHFDSQDSNDSKEKSNQEQVSSDFISRRESIKNDESYNRKIEPQKSSLMINRSIKRVQKLFAESNDNTATYSDIKSAKSRNLKERARRAAIQTKQTPIQKSLSERSNEKALNDTLNVDDNNNLRNTKKLYSKKVGYDTSSVNSPNTKIEDKNIDAIPSSNIANSRLSNDSELPSPEQLLQERERRRKLRIEQLEKMTSNQEIEDSYRPISSRWQQAEELSVNHKQINERLTTNSNQDMKSNLSDSRPITHIEQADKIPSQNETTKETHDNNTIQSEEPFSNSTNNQNLEPTSNQSLVYDDSIDLPKEDYSKLDKSEVNEAISSDLSSIHLFSPSSDSTATDNDDLADDHTDGLSAVEATEQLPVVDSPEVVDGSEDINQDNGNQRKGKRQIKKDKYSLEGFTLKDKTIFGLNVTFNVIKRLILYLIIIIILMGALVGGVGIGYFANLVSNTPAPSEQEMAEQINRLEQQSTLYYGNGEPIANVRTDIVRSVANLSEISNYIVDGFIATEDEYFEEHPGIVPKALIRAVLESFISGSGTGGSTLTQQLVKQQLLSNDVTFFRKANEILLALRLENYFSKEEILTAYLNVSPFGRNNNGENVAGIVKASEGIFGVSPNEVTLNQAAFLAGLPQDPYSYTPYNQHGEVRDEEALQYGIDRMKEVLYRMYREEKITKEEYETAIAYDITQDFLPPQPREEERQSYLYQAVMNGAIEQLMLLNIADDGYTWQQVFNDVDWYNEYYFAAEDQLRTGGYRVYSTIDQEIYDQLQESAQAYNDQLGVVYDGVYTDPETGVETYYVEEVQTGLVVLDNNTGAVLGFVAGTDYDNNQIDHAFQMRRSPGSTIKPLAVYGPAVENNIINPSTIIPDTAFVETYDDGSTWAPTNYGNVVSSTLMTARTALLRSDNLPAVRIYNELLNQGVPIIDYLERMGFNTVDSYTEEDTRNLAFSLGGVTTGPTVFEETRAFSTFATGGEYVDGYYIERIEDAFGNTVFQQNESAKRVFSEDTNYLMVDMLRDTMTEGTGRTANEYMNVPGDWIAKSGISENSKDIWFIASTPSITIGSWIGYDSRYADYTIDVNDGFDRESVRSQIYWARIVNDLYEVRPEIFGTDQTFQQPASVQEQTVLEQTGTLPGTITYNGSTYQLTGPTKTELFKVSNPAPELTFEFMLGASEDDLALFWNNIRSQQEEQRRQQQQQQTSSDESDESDEDESSEDDETTDNPDENTDSSDEEDTSDSQE